MLTRSTGRSPYNTLPLLPCRSSSGSEFGDPATPTSLHRHLLSQQRQPLLMGGALASVLHGGGVGAGRSGRRPLLAVEFRDLGLRLRSCGKVGGGARWLSADGCSVGVLHRRHRACVVEKGRCVHPGALQAEPGDVL